MENPNLPGKPNLAEAGAAVYSPLVLKLYDVWVLGLSNRFAWQCSTRSILLPFFEKHLGRHHLDVGVGSGFYLANARFPLEMQLTLMDLNVNSLRAAAMRSRLPAAPLLHDVMRPLPPDLHGRFDSISLFYLLHCLPGAMTEKQAAISSLKAGLAPSGILYGATILGDTAGHNAFGRKLMEVYNRKGIFGNRGDTQESLQAMLDRDFAEVNIIRHGKVALFSAREPL